MALMFAPVTSACGPRVGLIPGLDHARGRADTSPVVRGTSAPHGPLSVQELTARVLQEVTVQRARTTNANQLSRQGSRTLEGADLPLDLASPSCSRHPSGVLSTFSGGSRTPVTAVAVRGVQYGPVMAAKIDLTLDCANAQLLADLTHNSSPIYGRRHWAISTSRRLLPSRPARSGSRSLTCRRTTPRTTGHGSAIPTTSALASPSSRSPNRRRRRTGFISTFGCRDTAVPVSGGRGSRLSLSGW